MKKLISTFLIILLIYVNINFTYSYSVKNSDPQTINYLIKYVNEKTEDIKKMQEKYDLIKDETLELRLNELENIKKILLQTKKTWEYNEYIKNIVEQLKQNNNSLKSYLKEKIKFQKEEAKNYTLLYYKKIKPVLNKIDDIVINIAAKLMKKNKINSKDKQIIAILILIKQKIEKLENLTDNSFNTVKELREYIMSNFKQITFHFRQIKNIVKQ